LFLRLESVVFSLSRFQVIMTMTSFVDVALSTYNHERFIAAAIEGVLNQKTDFTYRLIIGDDCSTDSTQSIIRGYAEMHPDLIVPVLYSKNVGPFHADRVWLKTLSLCTAKYVTLLDGDDYWTDPLKLQKQVAFLESHQECAICFHNVCVVDEDGAEISPSLCSPDQKEISTLADIVAGNYIPACSVMFRNKLFAKFPEVFYKVSTGDWMLHVINAQHGHIGYISDIMAAYRKHSAAFWTMRRYTEQLAEMVRIYETIDAYLGPKYHDVINVSISTMRDQIRELKRQEGMSHLAEYHVLSKSGRLIDAMRHLVKAVRLVPAEALRPRSFAAEVKNGFVGLLQKGKNLIPRP
jgi:glycosyltransferase involved in cell wall biosynthesis